jgi:adenosine kinase
MTSATQSPTIVLTGSVSVDQIMHFDGKLADLIQPDKLEHLSLSVLLSRVERTQGGIATNIAHSLVLLQEKPALLVSVGRDQTAYVEDLAASGINTDRVHFSDLPTASFTVLTDASQAQIGGFYPGAMSDAKTLLLQQFAGQNVLIVVSAHDPNQMAVQLREAATHHLRLVFDIGQQVAILEPEVILQGLRAAELLLVNEYELQLLCARTGLNEAEVFALVPTTVVTLGDKGCQIHQSTNTAEVLKISAVPAQVVDPTGAGDAFRAGFLYGVVRNWPLVQSAQLGATIAAYAVESHGTQNHHCTLAEMSQRHQKQYGAAIDWNRNN